MLWRQEGLWWNSSTFESTSRSETIRKHKLLSWIQIEWEIDESSLLNQKQKILETLGYMNIKGAKLASTPMEVNYLNQQRSNELLPDNKQYGKAIERLLYISILTHPDITAAVDILCRKTESPSKRGRNAANKLAKYLHGTAHLKLKLLTTARLPSLLAFWFQAAATSGLLLPPPCLYLLPVLKVTRRLPFILWRWVWGWLRSGMGQMGN